jgi:exosortase/archaeosortase family protein
MYDRVVLPLTRGIAWLTHTILRAVGTQAWASGATVGVPGFAVEIKNNCNAIYEIGLYSAAVWAYPAPLLQRAAGVMLGTITLSLINLIRILSLLALGRYWPWGFQAAHVYVWQALFLAVVTACWFGWANRVRPVT